MDQGHDLELEEMIDEVSREDMQRRKNSVRSKSLGRPLIWGWIAVIVLVVAFVFYGWGDKDSARDLDPIKIRLGKLENRIKQLEGQQKEMMLLNDRLDKLVQSAVKLEESRKSLSVELYKIDQEINLLNAGATPVTGIKRPTSSARKESVASSSVRRYHKVQSGESLYQIARKYNISFEKLLKINNLSKNKVIYPGQKLLIDTSEKP